MGLMATYLMPHPPIMIPEVGRGGERQCQDTIEAARIVANRIKELKPETIVVITPHGPVFSDGVAIGKEKQLKGDLFTFGHGELTLEKENDMELTEEIIGESFGRGIITAEIDKESAKSFRITVDIDHGVQVPLYFVEKEYPGYKLVHITYGLLAHHELYKFGMCIRKAIDTIGRKAVIIASGDLSHKLKDSGPYEYHPSGEKFDREIIELLTKKEFFGVLEMDEKLVKEAGECGKRSIEIMMGALDGYDFNVEKLSYEGPFGVGYGVLSFEDLKVDGSRKLYDEILIRKDHKLSEVRSNEDSYVRLARKTLEQYVKTGTTLKEFDHLPDEMMENRAGVFVSIKNSGGLRGCIGTIGPTEDNIALEIVRNAINAGSNDPRFPAISESELNDLTITVDVLSAPEKIDTTDKLDPIDYGVIVTAGYKRGLLLPNLEGVATVEEQLRIAMQKGGISSEDDYELERFRVFRHY